MKAMVADMAGLRRDEVLFEHFPRLRTLLRDMLQGRRAMPLQRFVANDAFMNNWHVRMRYTDGREVVENDPVARWARQARDVVNAMGT